MHLQIWSFYLNFESDKLTIKAIDDGVGFNMEEIQQKGIGLENMKTRAKLINADINLESKPNIGTELNIYYYF